MAETAAIPLVLRLLAAAVRVALTLLAVVAAVVCIRALWLVYMVSPWTRDGRVRAYVVDVAPEVPGTVVEVPVRDNQLVRRGDVLFRIDPVRFRLAIAEAQAHLATAQEDLRLRLSDAKRRAGLSGIVSAEEQERFASTAATARSTVDAAQAMLDVARLNLSRSTLYSPVNGYVTNLQLRAGDYVTAGAARIAVLDSDSFWVNGYFEETKLAGIHVGDPARIALMGFEPTLDGHVESIAAGISDQNGTPNGIGLQEVSPVFTWVRLAQRIPVRVGIDHVPPGVRLAAGMTCSVALGSERQGHDPLQSWLERHL